MLKINDNALNYVKRKNLCFVVSIENISIDCDCCHTNLKTFKTKTLFENEVIDKELYDIYEYLSVKVFVSNRYKEC